MCVKVLQNTQGAGGAKKFHHKSFYKVYVLLILWFFEIGYMKYPYLQTSVEKSLMKQNFLKWGKKWHIASNLGKYKPLVHFCILHATKSKKGWYFSIKQQYSFVLLTKSQSLSGTNLKRNNSCQRFLILWLDENMPLLGRRERKKLLDHV